MFWRRKKDREADLERELASDLELEAEEQRENGLSPQQAHYAARRALGNAWSIKEQTREVWAWVPFDRLLQDTRFSLRQLRRSPGFALFAVLALVVGLGANVAIFSVFDAVLLRPLPFRNADRLVEIWEDGSRSGFPKDTPAPANYVDWKLRNHTFQEMAALKNDIYALTGDGAPEQVEGSPVNANLFPLLGVSPLLGRNFSIDEDQAGGPRVVLLSYGLWQSRYGADRSVLSREILLNGEKFKIIGVMPAGITFPERSALWVPLALSPAELLNRESHYLHVVARLKPHVSLAQAQREMAGIAAQLARQYPETNTNLGTVVMGLRDQLVGDLKPALQAVAVAVSCVLLIACANLAGLMLARGAQRERELALRAALGAGRARLIQQMLVESLLLGGMGGVAGVALASGALPFVRHLVPLSLKFWSEPRIDLSALVFLFLISLAASILFGVLPAFVLSQSGTAAGLQSGGRAAIGGRAKWRRALIVGEVSIAMVLLVAAGLLTKTLWDLAHAPLGFRSAGLLTLRTSLPQSSESAYRAFTARLNFYSQVLERVRRVPGVISAGYTTFLPLTNAGGTSGFTVEGAAPLPPGQINDANHRVISADYLQTLGVKLRSGRFFRETDTPGAAPVALVNEAMARQYLRGRNPVGRRFKLAEADAPWITIVGVIDDVRQMGLDLKGRAEIYFPYTQPAGSYGYFTPRDLAVRVQGDPLSYTKLIQREIWAVDRNQPIADVKPMEQLIAEKLMARDVAVKMIAAFAALALLLAALGLYGLLAYSVAQRRREIGVRMALGALPFQVLRGFLAEGLRLVMGGLLIGAAGSWFVMRALRSLLYGVAPTDAWVFMGSALVLLTAGALASYWPAQRAAAIDPVIALACE